MIWKRKIGIVVVLLSCLCCTSVFAASGTCDLAQTVAQKAQSTFAKDQAAGLKLFIKAQQLCSDDARYNYNLGLAYYQYGRLGDAIKQVETAVTKDDKNPLWLNNLAAMLLQQGGKADQALKYAEKAERTEQGPAVLETLARARFAAGHQFEALEGLHQALTKAKDNNLQQTYATLLDSYLALQLEIIASGDPESGLKALERLTFEPQAWRTRSLVLVRTEQGEEALRVAGEATKKFPDASELREVANEVGNQVALSLYEDFQAGQGASAVQKAKRLAETYRLKPISEAYEKLLTALLEDATSVQVPEAVARKAQAQKSAGRAEQLLAGLGSGAITLSSDVDLKVDIDDKIPNGAKAGTYDVAVVIGNRNYRRAGVPAVDYAIRDARTMNSYLIKTMGFDKRNIIYIEDAGLADFFQVFGSNNNYRGKLYNFVKADQSKVFIYYVGHGAPELKTGDAYFVPVDADPQYLKNSGYLLKTFYDNLGKLPATQITVVLDACFSGNSDKGLIFSGVSSLTLKLKDDLKQPDNVTVIASSQNNQVSTWYPEKRHSLFTYYFLKGLGGEADSDRNSKLTVAELETYLQDKVPYEARRLKGNEQNPSISGDRQHVLAILK